jgi:hypothetical protein
MHTYTQYTQNTLSLPANRIPSALRFQNPLAPKTTAKLNSFPALPCSFSKPTPATHLPAMQVRRHLTSMTRPGEEDEGEEGHTENGGKKVHD